MVANINIKVIARSLQPRLFLLFFLGCLGTAIGGVIAYILFTPLFGAEDSALVVSATTAMFTGGSMNWVAVASALRMPATLSAAAFPAGILVYTLYLTFIVYAKAKVFLFFNCDFFYGFFSNKRKVTCKRSDNCIHLQVFKTNLIQNFITQ